MLGIACLAAAASAQQDVLALEDLVKAPAVTIDNGSVAAKIYLPDAHRGFYRGTRFDWAGVIGSLVYRGHDFYVPWFHGVSPNVRDIEFRDGEVIVATNTGATGPVEEFNAQGGALGYAETAPGGTFVKIGVGVLRRPDDATYSSFRRYPIVDLGERESVATSDQVELIHRVTDPASGYGYDYTKTVRLLNDQPVMMLEHELHNTGSKPINTLVYNHNFLNIDGGGTSQGLELRTAYAFMADRAPDPDVAEVRDGRFIYLAAPPADQRVAARLNGFGAAAADNGFHIVQPNREAGLRITGDQPLVRVSLWSIQPVMSIEPFTSMNIAPGESFRWSYRYEYEAGAGLTTEY